MTFKHALVLAVALACCFGCSSKPAAVAELAAAPASLLELGDLLRSAAGANGRPPTGPSDLDAKQHLFPQAYKAVKNGDVVVLWGAPPKGEGAIEKGEGNDIIAYEKNVPTEGGWVLLSAGSVKKMSAADFNAAPKAGKPSR